MNSHIPAGHSVFIQWTGLVRLATIGAVTGAAALSGCRGAESTRPPTLVDTTARVCPMLGLIVTPATATLNIGQTLQVAAARPCTLPGPAAFIFASSAPTVATVDSRSGAVTAVSSGTTIITVTDSAAPTLRSGTSAITVANPLPMGLMIRSISDSAGNPALLSGIAGTITVVLNIETGPSSPVSEADLLFDWGRGGVLVASTHPNATAVGSLATMTINTAARDSSGALLYPNGAVMLKARLTSTSGQVFSSQNTISMVLKN